MILPNSNNLPISKLAGVFNSTSATYKFYWFLGIIELVEEGKITILKKEIFNLVGFFYENLKYGEDQHLWFRLANYTTIFFQSDPLVFYRMDDHQISNQKICNRDISNDLVYEIHKLNITSEEWDKFKSHY